MAYEHESSNIIVEAINATGHTQAEIARMAGVMPQSLNKSLKNGSLRADMFLKLLELCGVKFTLTAIDTGREISKRPDSNKGHGRRLRKMVNGITYDTASSLALSNSFYDDGENEYTDGTAKELYKDKKTGTYFFAEYSSLENGKDRITPVEPEEAEDFIKRHGTNLHKNNM